MRRILGPMVGKATLALIVVTLLASVAGMAAGAPGSEPGPPIDLDAVAGPECVHLTWDAPADSGGSAIRYYEIYRADGSGSEICLGSSVGTSYDDSRALGGQTYNYFVKAVNSHGLGPSSIIDSANVKIGRAHV